MLDAVLLKGRALDDAMDGLMAQPHYAELESRDRGFARLMATSVLRHHGSLTAVIDAFLERPLPREAARVQIVLLLGAAQMLLLATAPHAAINLAVEQCRQDRATARFDKLVNAVLRRVSEQGPARFAALDRPRCDVPAWMWDRWVTTYGDDVTARIAAASLREAALDLSTTAAASDLAAQLDAIVLPTGTMRLRRHERIESLPGFDEGTWWVQDAAAALPVRLLGDVKGLSIADVCAAPGGKTAALAAAGAHVVAVDQSAHRLARLQANMARLGLTAQVEPIAADIRNWQPSRQFDALLLDAPCTATGTIRRHPDILHLKRPGDVERLAALQLQLLQAAAPLVRPGGRIVYCTCSLEPEEGEGVIESFMASKPGWRREPVRPSEIGGEAAWLSPKGDLRTLPFHLAHEDVRLSGMDGFYACRLMHDAV